MSGALAYVWPALMVATVLATFGGVAFTAWRDMKCDARHTPIDYSAARQAASVVTSPTAPSAADADAETE